MNSLVELKARNIILDIDQLIFDHLLSFATKFSIRYVLIDKASMVLEEQPTLIIPKQSY